MQKIIFSTIVLLFMACGGGGSDHTDTNQTVQEHNNSSSSEEIVTLEDNSNVTPLYNYSSDGTLIRTLDNSQVNQYEEIEILLEKLKNDQKHTEFDAKIDQFVNNILTFNRPVDAIPSYAPRGANKSLLVEVNNGQIDYSSYQLKGDVNGDYHVDFEDIKALKTALFEGSSDLQYDSNGDGRIDIKDIVYTTAHLNSEIAYFDFYDTQKHRLDIPQRTINDPKTVTYSGSASTILVVAKDENGASGYINGELSDSSLEWYHQSGWQIEEISETNTSKSTIMKKSANEIIIGTSREVVNIEPDPYLLGWKFSIKYTTTGGLEAFESEQYGIESWRWFFEGEIEPKIKSHFMKTKMEQPIIKYFNNMQYIYQIGSRMGKTNEVKAKDFIFKYNYTLDGKRVTLKRIVEACSVLFESQADKTFKAIINTSETIKGKATLKRVGPTPKEEEFEGEVNDNEIEVKNVPFGAYDVEIKTQCGCKIELEKAKVFEDESGIFNLSLDSNKLKAQKLTLIVTDNHNQPLENKEVELDPKDCLDQGRGSNSFFSSQTGTTDNVGQVDFEDILIGEYRVLVDGKYIQDIHFCENDVQEVTIDPLWRLKVEMNSECLEGTATVKKFSLDCQDGLGTDPLGTICAYVEDGIDTRTNSTDVSFSYTGDLTFNHNGNSLEFYNTGITVSGDLNDYCDQGAVAGEYMSSGSIATVMPNSNQQGSEICNGNLPTQALQAIENNEKYSWNNTNHGLSCNFTLEPCQNEACGAY